METEMPIRNAEDQVRAVQAELGKALKRKDLDRALSHMTTDVTFLTDRGPAVIGHEAVRRLYADLFARFELTVADAQCTVGVLGDAAVVVGQQTTTLVSVRGGRAVTVLSRTVAIYRREGRSWRLARAFSVVAPKASSGGTPVVKHVSELLRRAQAEPGRIIYPEVA